MNSTVQLVVLKVGPTIGIYTAVDDQPLQEPYPVSVYAVSSCVLKDTPNRNTVPGHLQPLFDAAKNNYQDPREAQILA